MPLGEFSEQAFANALMRLMRGSASLVLWLEGHGERKLDGIANHDLGEFGRQLQQKGLKLNSVNLALAQEVPSNAALLVIASPKATCSLRKSRKSSAMSRPAATCCG